MTTGVTFGLEACLGAPPRVLRDARFGLLSNQASVDRDFRAAHEVLGQRFPGQLRALFCPQHGLWGEQQDNMIETPHARRGDGVPILSLYADTRQPTPAMLEGLDCLVIDLQDVGTRVYTYAWTMLLAMRACAAARVAVVVLDRPNPLGGALIEGPLLQPDHASFVGMLPIPMRHGLTLGELAQLINRDTGAELEIVAMQGWRRGMTWDGTGRAWVPPSPNLPRFEGATVYPGQVLLEGTNLSEGRGTTTPFEVTGAPFIDPLELAHALDALSLPGVVCRPYRFEPTFHKFAGQSCGGVFLHVTDVDAFRPLRTTLALLASVRALYPGELAWRPPPYEYEEHKLPIDILTGSADTREALDSGIDADDVVALTAVDEGAWWKHVADCLLYARQQTGDDGPTGPRRSSSA